MDYITILGIVGLVLILVAFFFNLIHKFNSKSKKYLLLNIFGSALLAYYALYLNSIPFFILQIVWGVMALIKLLFILFKK
jgi:hypothetical protein